MSEQINVYKFTLSSKKVIYLRDPKIADTESATQVSGKIAGSDNAAYLGVLFQKEMVKLLLVQINDKKLTMNEKQNLDALFTMQEYSQVSKAIQKILGDEGNFELTPELTTM